MKLIAIIHADQEFLEALRLSLSKQALPQYRFYFFKEFSTFATERLQWHLVFIEEAQQQVHPPLIDVGATDNHMTIVDTWVPGSPSKRSATHPPGDSNHAGDVSHAGNRPGKTLSKFATVDHWIACLQGFEHHQEGSDKPPIANHPPSRHHPQSPTVVLYVEGGPLVEDRMKAFHKRESLKNSRAFMSCLYLNRFESLSKTEHVFDHIVNAIEAKGSEWLHLPHMAYLILDPYQLAKTISDFDALEKIILLWESASPRQPEVDQLLQWLRHYFPTTDIVILSSVAVPETLNTYKAQWVTSL